MTLEQAFKRDLPKWPCCIMYGDPVTEEQALEIIRRTDDFFDYTCGNNREFIKKAINILHLPQFTPGSDFDKYWEELREWKEKWGFLELTYLSTSWISSSYIGGPHGWCQPTGKIAARHNIGKWPTVEEVYKELCTIAKEFPFLSMSCVLLDSEDDTPGSKVAVAFKVDKGEVSLLEGITKEEAIDKCGLGGRNGIDFYKLISDRSSENYFPLSQIEKWYNQVFNK